MDPRVGTYVFLLGLTSGIALLATTAYRRVSPLWLRGVLLATGCLMMSRYLAMALFTRVDALERFWTFRYCWFASSIGLTLPSAMAIDQLLRHPAMSPTKLLRLLSPFLLASAAIVFLSPMSAQPDHIAGWVPRLHTPGQWLLNGLHAVFIVGFIAVCGLLIRKIPSPPIQVALCGLAVAQASLGLDGLLLALGTWYVRPFLYSEALTLCALWHAYETSARLQQSP